MNRKIDELGRLVIPKEMRNSLGLSNGDIVNIELKDDTVIISNPSKTPSESEKIAKAYKTTADFENWLQDNDFVAGTVVLDYICRIQKDLKGE